MLASTKPALWLRLKHYHFDHLVPAHLVDHVMATFGGPDAATRAFASKLSRKLGWTPVFAFRAIAEYRKFLYLGVVSEVPVTPSKVIDQVWHEHLLFTRGYEQFCQEVLGRPFDHHPELMSTEDQTEVFQSQYEATLDLYEAEFNCEPPPDIWSTPKFKPGLARVRRALRNPRPPRDGATQSSSLGGDVPLYSYFDGGSGSVSYDAMPEFGGGGGFSGGGGESSWADSFVSSLHGSDSSSHAGDSSGGSGHGAGDSTSSDGGGSDGGSSDGGGSDGGSSVGGCSGCSWGCGGGGCGGGGE
jgi:hypothetical protein